jgi:hypothetical protein
MPPRRLDPWEDDDPPCRSMRGFAVGACLALAFWLVIAVAVSRCSS